MADIVNLRRFRKTKRRAEAAAGADENRMRFGRTKGEAAALAAEASRDRRVLDGHARETVGPDSGAGPKPGEDA